MKRASLTKAEKEQVAFLIALRNRYLEEKIKTGELETYRELEWFKVQQCADRAELRKNRRIKAKLGYPDML